MSGYQTLHIRISYPKTLGAKAGLCQTRSEFSNSLILAKRFIRAKLTNTSRIMRKAALCICENKDADQLRSNCKADQRLCFRYTDGIISLLSNSEICSLQPSPVLVQTGLCRICTETTSLFFFFKRGSFFINSQKGLESRLASQQRSLEFHLSVIMSV